METKEARELLKENINNMIDKKFNEFQKSWYKTDNPEIAQLRLGISILIFGNDGILDEINKIFDKN